MAIRLAKTHGAGRTSVTRVFDDDSLNKRAEVVAAAPRPSRTAFLELASPVMVANPCRLELGDALGVTMRGQPIGYDTADIEALSAIGRTRGGSPHPGRMP